MRTLTCHYCEDVYWNDRGGINCFICGRFGSRVGRAPSGTSGNRWQPNDNDPAADDIYAVYSLMEYL